MGVLDPVDLKRTWIPPGHRLFDRVAALPVPVFGARRGFVFGGGLEFAAACDICVASPDSVFGLPEATIGATPGWSGAQRVRRLMPQPLPREMALAGEQSHDRQKRLALAGARLSAEQLWSVGFVNRSPRPQLSAVWKSPNGQPNSRLAPSLPPSFLEKRKPRFKGDLTLVHALGIGSGLGRFAHPGLVRRVVGGPLELVVRDSEARARARTMVESNIWMRCAVELMEASVSKKASKTPALLRRSKRSHTLFQGPTRSGSARQRTLSRVKK